MAQEFKIGRLRFTWQGAWKPSTTYTKDAIVSYQGKTYVCLIANTSDASSFYSDLYYVTGSGATTPLWNLIVEGKTFTGTWVSGTPYSLGNIAIFGGQLYYCTTQHTSTAFASQSSYWALYTQFPNWHITWTVSTVYGIGDVVKYGGIVYQCIANHTSASTTSLGLENDIASWKIFSSGVEYRGVWTASTQYKLNDLAKLGDNIYQCTIYNSDSTFTPANWTLWLPGQQYSPTNPYSAGATYQLGDTVEYGGYTYISKVVNNSANTPSTSSSSWSLFTQGFSYSGEWNSATSYIVGTIVRRHGRVYSANTNNLNQDPAAVNITTTYTASGSSGTTLKVGSGTGVTSGMYVIGVGFTQGQTVVSVSGVTVTLSAAPDSTTTLTDGQQLTFTGINYLYWNLLVPSTYWTKNWVVNNYYSVGDIALWQNITYVCIQSHSSAYLSASQAVGATNNRPDIDTGNAYWSIYVTHARKNAMNTAGDTEYYSSSTLSYTALPIGTNSFALRTNNTSPAWAKINAVSNVYYVCSTTGQDVLTYGTTWDQPFKSIAYACNLVLNGTQFPNGVALLLANKSWILAEMIQWAKYQIANNLSPYTSAYVFDTVKASRDAGYIIDAIAYDIGRGGNSQTIAAALAFFAFGQKNQFFSSAVAVDVPYYLPMLTYLTNLINYTLTQTTPAINYQTTNGITPVIYQTTGLPGSETNAVTGVSAVGSAATLIGYVTTSLTTQSTAALPPPNTGVTVNIFVKTGTYNETLPITVPSNTAIVGDELRGVIVQPNINIIATATTSSSATNTFTVNTVTGMVDQQPIMFAIPNIINVIGTTYAGFGGITTGQKYYIVGSTINSSTLQVGVTSLTGSLTYQSAVNIVAAGSNATFTVSPLSTGLYSVSISYAGTNYLVGDTLRIPGGQVNAPTILATAMVQGVTYTIASLGTTNFTLNGASNNTVGTSFVASAVAGLGTGTVNLSVNDVNITVRSINGTGGILTLTNTGSTIVQLSTYTGGSMTVYAGDNLKDMFRLRNGTGLRNMTLTGLAGTLGQIDSNLIQRPTGGSYACLDPGTGPNDTTAWIFRRSPYVQNVTAFGNGCTALKIDGTLHNGGNKSIVCNDFTHIVNDGIGIWCTGPSSLCEAVSVFSYYGYSGYMAEAGGRIRATNGNSSYGTYGVIAIGYDVTETPATGIVYNQSSQSQATVQSSYGSAAQLLRLSYANAGSAYNTSTTNLLNFSNNFLGANWVSDSNVVFSKNTTALTGITEAWTLQGLTSGPDGSYVYQNIAIPAAGATYTNISAVNVSGSGSGATFNVTVTSTAYVVTVYAGGSGYVGSNQLYIAGGQLGGVNSVNDCIITVFSLSGSSILTVTATGTVPINSALNYTLSVYVKKGTATSIDIQGIFSGSQTVTSGLNYNFVTGVSSVSNSGGGVLSQQYGAISQAISTTGNTVGWYRIWFAINDTTGLNTNLQFRIYPRGYNGTAGQYSYLYGAQTELSASTYKPNFYLEVYATSKYSAYANLNITGSGTGVVTIADEIRSASVFQTYVTTDSTGITGGSGYLTASNNCQSGTNQFIQLATSDTNTNANYTGMRVFINSGTGAGQYGYISYFDSRTTGGTPKYAWVLKESFTSLQIASTNQGTGFFTLAAGTNNVSTMYLNQAVQFIPTYFTTSVTSTNLAQTTVTSAVGGVSNWFVCSSTAGLAGNMGVTFSAGAGSLISNVVANYVYYVVPGTITATTFQISANYAGTVYSLNTASGSMVANFTANNNYLQATTTNMVVNYPIQFTGTTTGGVTDSVVYYISDIIDIGNFTISSTLSTVTVTQTTSGTNALTVASTASLQVLNPIIFTSVYDNIVDSQKYYISSIINSTQFTIASSLIRVTASATTSHANGDLITISDTTGLVPNQPIQFIGTSWEANILSGSVYYILAFGTQGVNGSITISQLPGQQAIQLTGGTGSMTAKTCPAAFTLAGSSGSMTGSSTTAVKTLSFGTGSMTATFSTSLFGGTSVTIGQTYYVQNLPTGATGTTFAVSLTTGTVSGSSTSASPITLQTKTGSMNVAAVGWDHINPGTAIQSMLDNSSVYYIEPRLIYSSPVFGQITYTSAVALSPGQSWTSMAYGNNYFIALPNLGQTAAGSSDGKTWTTITLPSSQSWSSIAYGNGYWLAIASGSSQVAVSKSGGAGWRTFSLPSSTTWSNITYGNGRFVAIDAGSTTAAYSTNYGSTWTTSYLPSNHIFVNTASNTPAVGNAQISTTQKQFGTSSLYLDGSANTFITTASSADYAYGITDFTIECWVYLPSVSSIQPIFDQRASVTEISLLLEISSAGLLRLYINGSYVITGNTTLSTNTWTHVAVSRTSGTTRLFVGGTVQTTTYADSNNYAAKGFTIGAYYTGASLLTGYIDEFRVTTALSRYTTTFTPSASAFIPDSNTVTLLHFDGANTSTSILSSTIAGTNAGLTYGNGLFVAIASGSGTASYSTDGATWLQSTLPATSNWSSIAFGQQTFVIVSSSGRVPAFSQDGKTWSSSNISVQATVVVYGNGAFTALNSNSTTAYTSEDCLQWNQQTVASQIYGLATAFGINPSNYYGTITTLGGQATGSLINAGCKTKGRPIVTSGIITSIAEWEPGGGYQTAAGSYIFSSPTLVVTDPNVTTNVQATLRLSNGTLSSPTFYNKGNGYNSNSTSVLISGSGYADQYQTGLTVIINNLSRLPSPGDSLTITGVSQIYKVTSAYAVYGTSIPALEANVSVSPAISTANATANGTVISIRTKYSQARLTNHDFLYIGSGDLVNSRYPLTNSGNSYPNNQTIEANYGRVFYTSTDQDGNFKVGNLFGVQQATGIVTLSASQFGLTGLATLSLGGISVGGSSVIVNQFSTDSTFSANSDNVVSTQKAIKTYLTSRLSQGGANTFTGQLTAGTVVVGGPNLIKSTIPNGTTGSNVKMINKVNFAVIPGSLAPSVNLNINVDGNLAALNFYGRTAFSRIGTS
jgi:hypothetical protein